MRKIEKKEMTKKKALETIIEHGEKISKRNGDKGNVEVLVQRGDGKRYSFFALYRTKDEGTRDWRKSTLALARELLSSGAKLMIPRSDYRYVITYFSSNGVYLIDAVKLAYGK